MRPASVAPTRVICAVSLFGAVPLLAIAIATTVEQTLVCAMVYFAVAWAAYFFVFVADRGASLTLGMSVALLTLCVGVPLGTQLTQIPPLSLGYAMTSEGGVRQLAGFVLADGLNEELLKALALWLVAFGLRRILTPSEGVFYGALSGLGFAVFEGYQAIAIAPDAREMATQMFLRATALPFLHATLTGLNGYFIALASAGRSRRVALCASGLAVASALHGAYDYGSEVTRFLLAALVHLIVIARLRRSGETIHELSRSRAA